MIHSAMLLLSLTFFNRSLTQETFSSFSVRNFVSNESAFRSVTEAGKHDERMRLKSGEMRFLFTLYHTGHV